MTAIAFREFVGEPVADCNICFRYVNFYAGKAVAKVYAAHLNGLAAASCDCPLTGT